MATETRTTEDAGDSAPGGRGTGTGGGPETAATDGESPEQLPLDIIFDVLKNRRRRLVLQYTRENEEAEPFTLSDIAEYIAAKENGKPVAQLTSNERKRVYVGLYQCHLPRMDDTGILDFDRNRGTIEMNESVTQLEPYLNVDRDGNGSRWPIYYGGVTVFGVLLYGAAMVPSVPLTLPVAMLAVLATLGCCSGLHAVLGT